MSASLRYLLFVGDLLFLNLSVVISFAFKGGDLAWISDEGSIYLLVFSNLAWLFLVMVSTPYNVSRTWTLTTAIKSQVAFLFIHLLIVGSLFFFFRQAYSFFQVALIYLIFIPLFFLLRVVVFYFRKIFTPEEPEKNFILIGRNNLALEIRRYFLVNPTAGYRFVAYLDFPGDGLNISELRNLTDQKNIHEIFVCVSDVSREKMQELINFGLNSLIKIRIVTAWQNHAIQLNQFDSQPGLDKVAIALDEPRNQFTKRIFDLIFSSLFAFFVLSWIIPIVGVAIMIDSKGPIFFVQLRSGRGNRPFKCFKFRTMKVNTQAHTTQASRNDPRITKLGHFLRKTSIDELPQFINVLFGSMSVVGPRPHMLKHTDEYSKLIEHFMGRHYIKPGITGLAQCMGYRGETRDPADMENRVRMDRYYIENWTFWFDVKIIFLTVISLIRGSDKAF